MYIAVFHIIIARQIYLLKCLSQWLSKNTKDIVDRYLLPVRDMQYTYLVC